MGAYTQPSGFQRIGELNIIASLDTVNIIQKLTVIELYLSVGKAHVQFFIRRHPVCHISLDFNIAAVGDDPPAYYIQQAQHGLYAREAIVCHCLGISRDDVENDKAIIE